MGLYRNGLPIHEHPTRRAISTGISYKVQIPGLVPQYEEFSVIALARETITTWRNLSWRDRASWVAWHRLKQLESLHASDAQQEYQERAAKRRGN